MRSSARAEALLHRYPNNETCAAAAIEAGCDQDCGSFYGEFGLAALEQGLITAEQLTTALARILLMRFKLGEFDPPEDVKRPAARERRLDEGIPTAPSACLTRACTHVYTCVHARACAQPHDALDVSGQLVVFGTGLLGVTICA